jgi:uncharacterized linocin/CFP29 family protein
MEGAEVSMFFGSGFETENKILSKRPYINHRGQAVIAVNTGKRDKDGKFVYREKELTTNATLRKDEWIELEEQLLESFRERLIGVEDLRNGGLVHPVGGLGVLVSEWETGSEITDAGITMDGESLTEEDRQEFGLSGVPIPIIQKRFRIGERVLLASRMRGAALDMTTGTEAVRAVARTSENMLFYGARLGNTRSVNNVYTVYGYATHPNVALATISDWSDPLVTGETILREILAMITIMEVDQRRFGPFNLYIPADYSSRFAEDFKAESDKSLRTRVLEDPRIRDIRVADAIHGNSHPDGADVFLVQMTDDTVDMAVGSDISTVQWASGSGWTNFFQVFTAWSPRIKTDFDGRCGVLHATVGT